MEGMLNFLADHYIWFAGVSIFFAFALIGLIYETKKKKKAENKTADAVAQPAQTAPQPTAEANPGVVVANQTDATLATGEPSLQGLEADTSSFNNLDDPTTAANAAPALVIDDPNAATPSADPSLNTEGTPAPSAEPSLVIDDPNAEPAPSAEPTLVIEDPSATPAPEVPAETPAAPEAAAPTEGETQTLGNPGQPPM